MEIPWELLSGLATVQDGVEHCQAPGEMEPVQDMRYLRQGCFLSSAQPALCVGEDSQRIARRSLLSNAALESAACLHFAFVRTSPMLRDIIPWVSTRPTTTSKARSGPAPQWRT